MPNLRKSTLWSVAEFTAVVLIQLFVMRYIVVVLGVRALAILSLTIIRRYGLPGLAIAQIANYAFTIFMSILVLKMTVGVRLKGLLRFNWETIRRIMSFGIGIQASSIAWGAFEASIRFIMSRFGGIEQVGTYEIAYKISSQARVLAFYVSQSLTPIFASLGASDKPKLLSFYRQIYARYALFAASAALAIVALSPLT